MAQLGHAEAQVEKNQGVACPNGNRKSFKGYCPSARAKLLVHDAESWSGIPYSFSVWGVQDPSHFSHPDKNFEVE